MIYGWAPLGLGVNYTWYLDHTLYVESSNSDSLSLRANNCCYQNTYEMASKLAVNWIYCPLLGPINVNNNQREAQHKHICKSLTESFLNYPRFGNFACLGMGTEIWELKLLTINSVSQILSLFFQLLLMELQYFWSLPSNAFRSQTIHLYRSQSWHFQPAPVVVVNFFRVTRPGMPVKNNAGFFFHDDVVS